MLAEALKKHGWSTWWDPRIRAGEIYDEVIEAALKAAKCVVVLWSRQSIKKHWVKKVISFDLIETYATRPGASHLSVPYREPHQVRVGGSSFRSFPR